MAVYTTIDNPELYFQVKTYSGTGSAQSVTFDGDEDMQPDLVWGKGRSVTNLHALFDSVRGTGKALYSDRNNAEENQAQGVTAFNSDGFSMGTLGDLNASSETFVAWCWKESATAGFDMVAYTGASGDQTFAHSLGVAPDMYIVKERGNANSWVVNHKGLTNQTGYYLLLNTTDAQATDSWFNATAPTSSVVSANDGDSPTNRNGGTYIMYLFAGKQGFSKFGKFEGNNNADGSFVYLGFKPAWIMIKDIDSSNTVGGSAATSWGIWDNKRMPANPASNPLWANKNGTETIRGNNSSANTGGADGNGLGGFIHLDMLSNGFKCRCATGELNDAQTYVYMAFAEAPFVNSNGVPCNAR